MLSDLHNRLEHLVSYSSQLMFVSGDSIAQQQRTLEAFLSQQSENTEIAYFSAEADALPQDFRRQLCRQLLGQIAGSFTRPLTSLLQDLQQHDDPVLICITQAQNLPDSFVQELWDLVLASREAGSTQHLNVLLLGESAWAEHAKTWLPAENNQRPLLLHTESVARPSPQQAQLAQLITEKREALGKTLSAPQSSTPMTNATTSQWWFKSLIGVLFIVLFAGILGWQYRQPLADWLAAQQQDHQTVPSPQQDAAPQPAAEAEMTQTPETQEQTTQQTSTDANARDQQLVTDWQSEMEKLSTAPSLEPSVEQQSDEAISINQADAEPELPATVADVVTDGGDFAIEDAAGDDQLQAVEAPSANQTGDSVAAQLEINSDEQALLVLPAESYVLQLAGIKSPLVLAEYLQQNQLAGKTWVYRTQRFGGDWHVVLVNQAFTSIEQARNYAGSLSAQNSQTSAFAKPVSQVHQEIAQNRAQ